MPNVRSLKGDRAFRRLRRGTSGSSAHLTVRWAARKHEGVHVGIVVSRKVGNAVTRNRVRRRLREALNQRMREQPLPPDVRGADLIVIARPSAAEAGYDALKRSLERALERSRFP